MELELHQLELRYARLRKHHPARERQLLASLAETGQHLPIIVVEEASRFVLIDGYKRVRALRRLAHDTVRGTRWEISEVEALLLERQLRCASEDAFDQAWLLAELQAHYGMSYIFISHDLAVVRAMSHQVMVMKSGDVVEAGESEALFAAPQAAYTRELLAAAHLA